jgi:hypothetical protein
MVDLQASGVTAGLPGKSALTFVPAGAFNVLALHEN